ncbi:Cro/Cl family transcriptional regulator [Pseudomonas sp. SDI]|uniref:helix-turn-helix domain-containing protein n=1 Tax=Pseudomonas sp. SDI TaxID=2170734 RepID=UPI000DE5ECE5|nr:XRE family transcriptional regulator [Pseudomonas sp. SDI]PWB31428.1 Cro/Cl family transcriptional regulator [Pseudomonas sp. SDI]
MHKDSSQRASVLQHVSQNIRRLRHAAELSQSALAEKSGVSRRMLVAIEAGEKNVSLTTLDRLAEALEVAFSDLIQAPDNRDPSRINELAWTGVHPGSKATLLASSAASREVELWEWRLEPGEVYSAEADADGWSEQLYVCEGELTLVIEDQQHRLAAGEFYSFGSNRVHAYRNDGAVATRFVRNVVI